MINESTWETWTKLSATFPAPARTPWLRMESGRVGRDHELITTTTAGAALTLVESSENRSGYTLEDLLGQDGALRAPGRPTALVAVTGAALPGIVHNNPSSSTDAETALRRLLGMLERRASDAGATGIHVGSVPDDGPWSGLAGVLDAAGYLPVPQLPEAVLDVPADGLEGLLGQVRPAQRKNIRREIRRFEDSPLAIEAVPAEALVDLPTAELLAQHYASYGHPATTETAFDRLQRVAEHPDATGMAVLEQGRIVGFSIFVADHERGELFPRLSACRRGSHFEFFNLVYYARISWAAQRGIRIVYYGNEGYAAKAQRGCHLEARTSYLKVVDADDATRTALDRAATAAGAETRRSVLASLPPGYQHLAHQIARRRPRRGVDDGDARE